MRPILPKPHPETSRQGNGTLQVRDVSQAIELAKRHLDAGAELVMIESEGITEQVREWRTDAVARIATELGLERVMFEAAEPTSSAGT